MDFAWPTITAAAGGWTLLGMFIIGLMSGRWFVSRREADGYVDRAEKAEALNRELVAIMAEQTGVGKLQKRFAEAAMDEPGGGET